MTTIFQDTSPNPPETPSNFPCHRGPGAHSSPGPLPSRRGSGKKLGGRKGNYRVFEYEIETLFPADEHDDEVLEVRRVWSNPNGGFRPVDRVLGRVLRLDAARELVPDSVRAIGCPVRILTRDGRALEVWR